MPSDWISRRIGDLAEVFDGPHATPKKTDEGPIFLGISSLEGGRLHLSNVEHLSEENFKRWTRRVLPRFGDVVFSYETKLGEAALIPEGLRCCLGRRMGLVRPKEDILDPQYFLYYYLSPKFQEFLRSRTVHGSTVDRIPLIHFPDFEILVPPISEQRELVRILAAIDGKITQLRGTNATLEGIAQALFKSWFVDFDPVRAKAEGRDPEGVSPEVADLFPSEFEDSDLGAIPKGWRVRKWGDLIRLEYGKALRDYRVSNGRIPVYGTNGHIGFHDKPHCNHPGIVVGRKGAYRGIHFASEPFCVIDTAFFMEGREKLSWRWAYYEALRFDLNAMDSGSAIPSTDRNLFYRIPICTPPLALQLAFEDCLSSTWEKQDANIREGALLSDLRDTILPRLMSGKLCVTGENDQKESNHLALPSLGASFE